MSSPVTYMDWYGEKQRTRVIIDPNEHTRHTIIICRCGFKKKDEIISTLRGKSK